MSVEDENCEGEKVGLTVRRTLNGPLRIGRRMSPVWPARTTTAASRPDPLIFGAPFATRNGPTTACARAVGTGQKPGRDHEHVDVSRARGDDVARVRGRGPCSRRA